MVALLVLLRGAAFLVAVPHGLQASYFSAPQWAQPMAARIDGRVSFGRENDPQVPALSVVWQGYMPARSGVDRQAFYLRGSGVTAELWVDGLQVVHLEPAAAEEVQHAPWPAALHRLIVRMTTTPDRPPQFDAGFVTTDGTRVPFDENRVLVKPASSWRVAADGVFWPLIPWLNGFLLVFLAWGAWRAVDFMVPPEEQ